MENATLECKMVKSPECMRKNRDAVFNAFLDLMDDAKANGVSANDAIGMALHSVALAIHCAVNPRPGYDLPAHFAGALQLAAAQKAMVMGQMAGSA